MTIAADRSDVLDLPTRREVMDALTAARLAQRRAEIDMIALIATAADAYGWVEVGPALRMSPDA